MTKGKFIDYRDGDKFNDEPYKAMSREETSQLVDELLGIDSLQAVLKRLSDN